MNPARHRARWLVLGIIVSALRLGAADDPLAAVAMPSTSEFTVLADPNAIIHADTLTVRVRDNSTLALQDLTLTPLMSGTTLSLADLQARAYGGGFSGNATIDTVTGDQHWRLALDSLDLAAVFHALSSGAEGQAGTIDGWAELDLPGGDLTAMHGSGELLVHDADLIRFGVLANLLIGDVMAKAHADSAELRFDIGDGKIRLRGSRITSPSAMIQLRGTIGLDGTLNLVVIPYPDFKAVRSVPVIGGVAAWLFDAASSRVGRAVVRGELGNAVISLSPFAD